jgi:hypothetical protein
MTVPKNPAPKRKRIRTRVKKVRSTGTPACFESKAQWDLYRASWRIGKAKEQSRVVNYCEDCLPEYRDRMREEKRCAHPDVVFIVDDDGFISGVRPTQFKLKQIVTAKEKRDENEKQ